MEQAVAPLTQKESYNAVAAKGGAPAAAWCDLTAKIKNKNRSCEEVSR
jgi:hypothetical protein